jgi:predicted TPR repeat methyltransferase
MTGTNHFIEIPSSFLAEIADDSNRIPKLYYASNPFLRKMFWRRLSTIARLIDKHQPNRGTCLDFGGGSGVLLPTLSARFGSVTLLDLEATQAALVQKHYRLTNVEIVEGDIACAKLGDSHFDAVVAADVLEHFKDLSVPVTALRKCLSSRSGMLFTSLPTETGFYRALRKVFGIKKPWDHYHTAYEVEGYLRSNGFRLITTWCIPFRVPILDLFRVSAWRTC